MSELPKALDVITTAVNCECSCGGAGLSDGCMACRVWHRAKAALRQVDRMNAAALGAARQERDQARRDAVDCYDREPGWLDSDLQDRLADYRTAISPPVTTCATDGAGLVTNDEKPHSR